MRRVLAFLPLMIVFSLLLAGPASAREFGTIYAEGDAYRTFASPAHVEAGSGTDPIVAFSNFAQGGVAKYAPGPGSHGGRWAVSVATWVNPAEAYLLTDYDDVMALVTAGDLTITRVPEADFRCPILPNA